jgi:hypothetical protein
MRRLIRLAFVILTVVLTTGMSVCTKKVETNTPGPGGLPQGIVEENAPHAESESKYPVYPGATERATNVYETPDSIQDVRAHYVELLDMEPEFRDAERVAMTFETDDYILVLLPLPSESGGGTEISFTDKN